MAIEPLDESATSGSPPALRPALAAAYAELFEAMPDRAVPPGRLHALGGATCSVTPAIDEPGWALYLNQVMGLGLARPATEHDVDEVLSLYRPGRRPFAVLLEADARPLALGGWLEARGLRRRLLLARCHRVPASIVEPADSLRVDVIGPEDGGIFAGLAGPGLPASVAAGVAGLIGRPGWRHSIAFEEGAAVAAGALFVHEGVGCLCWSVTRPGHRRRGAHASLIRHRLRSALEMGCRHAAAETLEANALRPGASQRNLLRAGFEPAPPARVYVGG